LLIHAHYPEGPALPWERDLTLGWNPSDLFGWREESPSPRGMWDAQYAHDWLLNELVPAVLRWDYQRALRMQPWWRRVLGIRDPRMALQKVDDWAYSLALDEGSDLNTYGPLRSVLGRSSAKAKLTLTNVKQSPGGPPAIGTTVGVAKHSGRTVRHAALSALL